MRTVSLQYGVPTAFNAVPLVLTEYSAQIEALTNVKQVIVDWGNKVVNKNFKPVAESRVVCKKAMYDANIFKNAENGWRGVYDKKELRDYLVLSEVVGTCRTYLGHVKYGVNKGNPSIQLNTSSAWKGAPSNMHETVGYHNSKMVSDWELELVVDFTEGGKQRLNVVGSLASIDERIEQIKEDMRKYGVLMDMSDEYRLNYFIGRVNLINHHVKSIEDTLGEIPYLCRGNISVD
jgi:hypothetical protein